MNKFSKINYISSAFLRLVEDIPKRLEVAKNSRKQMEAEISAGVPPTGYRNDFIEESVDRMIQLLLEVTKDFNRQFPSDRFSSLDQYDIIMRLKSKFLKKS